jgi:hypothetical protein
MLSPTKTIVVTPDQSVQDAINSAPDNSRIILKPGVYKEHIIISGKRIQLVAETPPQSFTATNTNVAPSYSVVFDGNGAKPAWNGGQSMIQVENSRRLEENGDSFSTMISGIEIRNNGDVNSQGQSAGITTNASDVVIKDNYLHDLKAQDGAAISAQNNSRVTAVNNLIWNNLAKRFGAIFDTHSTSGSIYASNNLKGNSSAEGSAFYQDFGTGFFLSNLVQDGISRQPSQAVDSLPAGESKGAVMLRKDSTESIILNTFRNNKVINSANPNSGAINIETEGSTNNILLNTFIGNSVELSNTDKQTGSGGAIGVFNRSTPIIRFNLFQKNSAGYGGSAIAASEFSTPIIKNNLFYQNSVQKSPEDSGFRAGSGTVFVEASTASVQSNYFENNAAEQISGLYLGDRSTANIEFNTFSDSSSSNPAPTNYAIVAMQNSSLTSNGYYFKGNSYVSSPSTSLPPNPSLIQNFSNSKVSHIDYTTTSPLLLPPGREITNLSAPAYSYNTSSPANLIQTPAIVADPSSPNSRTTSDGMRTDVQGYDRPADTLTGAFETRRQSTAQEMNVPVWRFRKGYGALAHFYTANEQEKNDLIKISQAQQSQGKQVDWIFEGKATNFNVSLDPLINYVDGGIQQILSPVYRFFNPLSGTHLYSIDSTERDAVMTNLPHYRFEGIAYYAYNGGSIEGGATLQRFFNTNTKSHFFTADPNEFNSVYANQASLGFTYDGQAFVPGVASKA